MHLERGILCLLLSNLHENNLFILSFIKLIRLCIVYFLCLCARRLMGIISFNKNKIH